MRLLVRRIPAVLLVAAGSVWVAWLGFRIQTTGDYQPTFAPAMNALLGGHAGEFFRLLPADGAGGSILLREPAALLGKLLGGGQQTIFGFGAFECVLACGLLGLWLSTGSARGREIEAARVATPALCLLAPALLGVIFFGHPEEALGAALSVAAVLLAAQGSTRSAGLALGLAVINKPWAVLAISPTLLAAPHSRRMIAAIAGGVVATWTGTSYLVAPEQFTHSLSALSIVAHPQELWWPLARLHEQPGVSPAYFLPSLVMHHARELVVALMLPLSALLARNPERRVQNCLALLALLLLLRCVLDPSNHIYYHLPFVIALVAFESRSGLPPMLALLATGLLWLVFHTISGTAAPELQWLAYLAVTLPMIGALLRAVRGRDPWPWWSRSLLATAR